MNMRINSLPKRRAHPMLIAASAAVVLFSVTATAAVLGWIPNSFARTASPDTVALAAPVAVAAPVHHVAVKAQPQRIAQADYSQRHEQWVHHAAPACRNCGIVESMRDVTSNGSGSGLGAAGGAVVGGLLGNQVGGGHGRDAMTVVGAIGGALAGNQIEKQVKTTHSYQTTVRMTDGSSRSVAQATQPEWRDGDHVKIVDGVVTLAG
jgi:outer membrane lipoprotein SlyB